MLKPFQAQLVSKARRIHRPELRGLLLVGDVTAMSPRQVFRHAGPPLTSHFGYLRAPYAEEFGFDDDGL